MNKESKRILKKRQGDKMAEDRIPIKEFSTARALKEEIRKRILARESSEWAFARITTNGTAISLRFEPKLKT